MRKTIYICILSYNSKLKKHGFQCVAQFTRCEKNSVCKPCWDLGHTQARAKSSKVFSGMPCDTSAQQ